MGTPQPKLPLAPLRALAANADEDGHPSERVLAYRLGVSRKCIQRWERTGIPLITADRLACHRLGLHPASVWPGEYHAIPTTRRKDHDDD